MAGQLHSIVLALRHAGLHATGYLEQSGCPGAAHAAAHGAERAFHGMPPPTPAAVARIGSLFQGRGDCRLGGHR